MLGIGADVLWEMVGFLCLCVNAGVESCLLSLSVLVRPLVVSGTCSIVLEKALRWTECGSGFSDSILEAASFAHT